MKLKSFIESQNLKTTLLGDRGQWGIVQDTPPSFLFDLQHIKDPSG